MLRNNEAGNLEVYVAKKDLEEEVVSQKIEGDNKILTLGNGWESSIPKDHDLVKAGIAMGRSTYGSPTLSDQSVLSCPSLKLGPGDSTRSHTADEYIYLNEIEEGVALYIELLNRVLI